jgi:hypothetical protein
MILVGDEDHVEARFGLFEDSANPDAREGGLRLTYHRLINRFECTQWNSNVTWVM